MRSHRYPLMLLSFAVILAAALGVVRPWGATAEAQHGASDDPIAMVAHALELTDDQLAVLGEPLTEAFEAVHQLQAVHATIAEELNDEQEKRFGQMVHNALAGLLHEPTHGQPHGGEGRP